MNIEPCSLNIQIVAALLIMAFLPRAYMAYKIGGLSPDAVLYIRLAQAYDHGTLGDDQFNRFALNLYPVILMLLHRTGLDWELAGRLWGVTVSTLTVLPLYGLVRRQWDDRTAWLASVIYALHAELIRWSPEGVRDPTFWFLWMLTLYLLWRASQQSGVLYYLAAGIAMALASLTRFEGLFLLIPLAFWLVRGVVNSASGLWTQGSVVGWVNSAQTHGNHVNHRGSSSDSTPPYGFSDSLSGLKPLLGAALALVVLPLALFLVSKIWFPHYAPWELFRTKPLEIVEHWWHGRSAPASGYRSNVALISWQTASMIGMYLMAMFKGTTPWFALLLLAGVWSAGKRALRSDVLPLWISSAAILLAIWIHLYVAQDTSKRYFLPIVLMTAPLAAVGAAAIANSVTGGGWRVKRRNPATRQPPPATRYLLAMYSALSLGNVIVADYSQRAVPKAVGRAIAQRCGDGAHVLGPPGLAGQVAYYAHGEAQLYAEGASQATIELIGRQWSSDALLLPSGSAFGFPTDVAWPRDSGFVRIDNAQLAGGLRQIAVYVRTKK